MFILIGYNKIEDDFQNFKYFHFLKVRNQHENN